MKSGTEKDTLRRQLPSVDELLKRPGLADLAQANGRGLVVEAARAVLEAVRAELGREDCPPGAAAGTEEIERRIAERVAEERAYSLRAVINATGVVLHTNLGRAPLGTTAVEHLREAVTQYSNLEYDVASGSRGKRDAHTARRLAQLCGAEAAIVVNNNAAAVFLVLSALAQGAEVVVSRGELIEIGDGFRIPDILRESGAVLREVGTTNRTHIGDYERAINERTRLLLRVHPSNFRVTGFTARVSMEALAELGRKYSLPVCEDLGSGCLTDFSAQGLDEPEVRSSLEGGATLVTFSGDKLLGGPQAGVIAGRRDVVERIRRHPMFRALRVDKLTIAVLEATLDAHARGAAEEIPALRMILMTEDEVGRRAQALAEGLRPAVEAAGASCEVVAGRSVVGGGSTPGEHLPTRLVALSSRRYSAAQLEARLRKPKKGMPVIARVEDDRLVLDLRTVFPQQESELLRALIQSAVGDSV